MATIEKTKTHALGIEGARAKAEELAKSLQSRFELEWSWTGDVINFKSTTGAAKGTSGKVRVAATSISVEVDLPLMLRPLKGMVEGKIQEKLDAIG
jgi:putative polyhydroxyalkanoate system protein